MSYFALIDRTTPVIERPGQPRALNTKKNGAILCLMYGNREHCKNQSKDFMSKFDRKYEFVAFSVFDKDKKEVKEYYPKIKVYDIDEGKSFRGNIDDDTFLDLESDVDVINLTENKSLEDCLCELIQSKEEIMKQQRSVIDESEKEEKKLTEKINELKALLEKTESEKRSHFSKTQAIKRKYVHEKDGVQHLKSFKQEGLVKGSIDRLWIGFVAPKSEEFPSCPECGFPVEEDQSHFVENYWICKTYVRDLSTKYLH